MKASVLAVAALLGGASAEKNSHYAHHAQKSLNDTDTDFVCPQHAQESLNDTATDVVCHVIVETITGDYIWTPTPDAVPAQPNVTTTSYSTTTRTTTLSKDVTLTSRLTSVSTAAPLPTPVKQILPTPGTYTFPETTVVVNETTTALVPYTTPCPPGEYVLGGVTTVVENATTIVCPYPTTTINTAGVVTSVIEITTYVCPEAGTYTIGPITTTVNETGVVTVPVIATYPPGTYIAPAVTTVVVNATVIYCPFVSSTGLPAPQTTQPAITALPPPPEPTQPAAIPVVAPPSPPVAAPSTPASPPEAAKETTAATVATTAAKGQWAITYTPYNKDTGNCQTADQVEADLQAIAFSGFTTIRTYSTDCDTLVNVGKSAVNNGLRIIPGIYISASGCTIDSPDIAEQVADFAAWAHWDLVEFFVVGNEALVNGFCSGAQLGALITGVRGALGAHFSGHFTTTDVVSAWQDPSAAAPVCAAVDFPSANVHSYFTSTVGPADAGEFVKGQLAIVEAACGNKASGYVLEAGFPTSGAAIGLNVPSAENQEVAIKSILDVVGSKTVLFSMFDDHWKNPGAYDCEQHWGLAPTVFGTGAEAWLLLIELHL